MSCDPKMDIFESCNFVCSKLTGFENLLCFPLSLTVSEIMANLRSRGHVALRGHVTKIDIFKSCNFEDSKPTGSKNLVRFTLFLTVTEIMANLRYRGHVTLRGQVVFLYVVSQQGSL